MLPTKEGQPLKDWPAHCRSLWGLVPCSRVPRWWSECVPAPPRTTTTPPLPGPIPRSPCFSQSPADWATAASYMHLTRDNPKNFLVWFHLWDLFYCPDMKSHTKIWGRDVVCFISIFFVVRHFLLSDHVTLWSHDHMTHLITPEIRECSCFHSHTGSENWSC